LKCVFTNRDTSLCVAQYDALGTGWVNWKREHFIKEHTRCPYKNVEM
jgi:hypothetical protein